MEKISTYNHILRLIKKVVIILLILFIIDQGIGMVLKHYYSVQKHGEGAQINYVIDSLHSDIIIFGSSRANHHYVPEIFESRTPYSCFNAGRDGNYVLYEYAIFKSVVARYTPKLIIIDIRPYELGPIESEYDRLSLLLPYYYSSPDIHRLISLRGPFEKYKHFSAIYPYNSMIFQLARNNIGTASLREAELKGYVPLEKRMAFEKIMQDQKYFISDKNKTGIIDDIISTCKSKKIELVFVYSPIWKITKENDLISDLIIKKGIRFIDMSNDSVFMKNPDYFEDISHLNDKGARIFTNMLIDKLFQGSELK